MKKILSMLLSLSMALSLLIVPGFAEEAIEGEEAVLMEETSENSTETQENESVPADDTEKTLSFNEHDEVIWPCIDVVKSYLLAGAEEDVNNYEFHVPIQAEPVTLSWEAQNITPSGYTLEIATESDFSDAKTIALDADATSYGFKFLLRDTKYYVRLTTTGDDVLTAQTEFSTAYGCPRFLDVGGNFNNCRDLGGYKVGDKTVLQNMVIRGSSPNNSASTNLFTEDGYEFLTETVGVKTQLDLRGATENGGITTSPLSTADNYVLVPLTAYSACFNSSQAELYREAFSLFADPENYPIYFHCAGGADRTGTLAAILLAYLGVSEDEIVQDYVVTTFSPVCYNQGARSRGTIMTVLNGLDNYNGTTLSEKAKSYLSSIGVTQRELYNIKAIMFGDSLDDYVSQKDYSIRLATNYYATSSGEDFVITLNESDDISDILIDSEEVSFQQSELTLTIPASVFTNLEDGAHKGEVVFSDGTKTEFTVNVNFYDLTGGLEVSSTTYEGDYAYVEVVADSAVFGTINYHFHTRRSTLYPDIEPNILINGMSVADLNDNTDMSSYTWNSSPGSTDSRHRVPVSIYSNGNTMKLLCRADWLQSYLKGQEMTITLKEGFNYTYEDITYRVLSDIMYQYTNGSWMKVMSGQANGLVSDELEIYSSNTDDLILTLTGNGIVKSISIDASSAAFTQNGKTVTLSNSALEGLSYGEHSGVIAFNDGATLSFTVNVLVDLSDDLSFTGIEEEGDYTIVTVSATSEIFDGINYHFHTKRSTNYPDVEPNILINGTSVADLNDNTDMSSYTWNSSPGSTDSRHRVPVTIRSQNETMKLLIKSDWLESYLNGSALEIALKKGLAYTYGGITYKLLSDISYTEEEKVTVKIDTVGGTVDSETDSDITGDQSFGKDEEITLTAKPSGNSTFKYWIEANTGKIISTSETLKMSGSVGRQVRAVFDNPLLSDRLITFYGKGNTVIAYDTSTGLGNEPNEAVIPTNVKAYRAGYNLVGWKLDNTGDVLVAGNLGTYGTDYYAVYERAVLGTYVLTLGEGAELTTQGLEATAIPYGTSVSVKAADYRDAGEFMYWQLGEDEIASYDKVYNFTMPSTDIELTPVYGKDAVTPEVKVTLTVNAAEATYDDGTAMAGFMISRYIPVGTKVVDTGIIYVRDSAYENLTVGEVGKTAANGKAVNVSLSSIKTTGQYKFNARYEYTTGIKAIAFVTYEVDGETITVYSKAETVSKITE